MLILCEWVELKARGIKKNAFGKKEGGIKGLLCHLFPFHSSSVAIEKKKGKLECFTFQVCHSNHLSRLKYCVKSQGGKREEGWV